MEARIAQDPAPPGPAMGRAIVLVGFMGAGKSTAARTVAAEMGVEPLDTDRELERRLGEPIDSFFDREGEGAFRAREEEVVLELLDRAAGRVVALGGGSVLSERVREALAEHTVVQLEVRSEDAWRRSSGSGRPLARDSGRFEQLQGDREPLYAAVAHAVIPPGPRDAVRAALPSLRALAAAPAGTRMVWARSESGSYPAYFGAGLIRSGFDHPAEGRRFVVTDSNVARLHPVDGVERLVVEPGEQAKTLAAAEDVLRGLARAGAERGDRVLAVGGGVVGDLAGFCAAVYQRGMRHVQVPTTLVSQVDSAYGGKTGVDLPEGKNYAGSYHQPSAVICDPTALETLPPEELAAGYAEVVKTALIAGGPLWARVRQGGPVDLDLVMGCARTKLAAVAEDERDGGRRQVLNLGHTVGHAIESATGYSRYRHGEAVAIGLLVALRLSGRDALRAEVAELLGSRGLPGTFEGASVDEVVALVARDKKRAGGRVPFVLLEAPGKVTPGHEVGEAELRAAVAEAHAA